MEKSPNTASALRFTGIVFVVFVVLFLFLVFWNYTFVNSITEHCSFWLLLAELIVSFYILRKTKALTVKTDFRVNVAKVSTVLSFIALSISIFVSSDTASIVIRSFAIFIHAVVLICASWHEQATPEKIQELKDQEWRIMYSPGKDAL